MQCTMEARGLSGAKIRRRLSALSSLFDYLCERNAVAGNPVDGVKRPTAQGNEGTTPTLGDGQARAPSQETHDDFLGLLLSVQPTRAAAPGTNGQTTSPSRVRIASPLGSTVSSYLLS